MAQPSHFYSTVPKEVKQYQKPQYLSCGIVYAVFSNGHLGVVKWVLTHISILITAWLTHAIVVVQHWPIQDKKNIKVLACDTQNKQLFKKKSLAYYELYFNLSGYIVNGGPLIYLFFLKQRIVTICTNCSVYVAKDDERGLCCAL